MQVVECGPTPFSLEAERRKVYPVVLLSPVHVNSLSSPWYTGQNPYPYQYVCVGLGGRREGGEGGREGVGGEGGGRGREGGRGRGR